MNKNFLNIVILFLFSTVMIFPQEIKNDLLLTGNLSTDSKIISNNYNQLAPSEYADDIPGKKSPVLSGLLSAVIPGAGQFYNEDWWIGGIFLAVEATLITVAVVNDNKGDDQTASFQQFADQNWSVVDYAEWLNTHQGKAIPIDPDDSKPPWERVDWATLNANEVGSHTLPPHGEQQYYELIGKYHQYSPGWNDFTGGSNIDLISPNFTFYAGERGLANDFYNTASTAVVGIYINHILSAVEAAWGAARFNNNINVKMRVENLYLPDRLELVPTLSVKYSF